MTETQVIAIMAAIVFAGADDPRDSSGYEPESAVAIARDLYAVTQKQISAAAAEAASQAASQALPPGPQ